MRAISPIIATVILVAVTIALAVGVALWMSGLIGGAGSREQIQLMPDSAMYVDSNGNLVNLTLHIKNAGSIDSKIVTIKVDTANAPGGSVTAYTISSSSTTSITSSLPVIVKAGQDVWLNITNVPGITFSPSKAYKITVYTDAGGSYFTELTPILASSSTSGGTTGGTTGG